MLGNILLSFVQFPQGDCGGGGDVEGIDSVGHWYFYGMVAICYCLGIQALALGTEDYGELIVLCKPTVVYGEGIAAKRHCDGGKAFALKICDVLGWLRVKIRPRDLKDGPHTDADTAAVEGVAGCGGEQERVKAQCCGVSEDRADVGLVHYILQNDYARCVFKQGIGGGKRFSLHSAQHTLCEFKACKLGERFAGCGIDGRAFARGDDVGCLTVEVLLLAQQGGGGIACGKCAAYDLGAFGDEQTLGLRLVPALELYFVGADKRRKCWV